jgi:hypothetical protein
MPASEEVQTEVAERRAKAVQLRIAGASLPEIAEALNYGGNTPESRRAAVSVDLARAFKAAQEAQRLSIDEWRELELTRLDRVQRGLWAAAVSGDTKAVNALLQVMAARRKYIPGLEAPTQVDATITETTQEDIALQAMIREAQMKAAATEAQLRENAGGVT